MIPCKLDLTTTTFCDTTIITYEIYLPPSGKKIGFNLLEDEDFTIPYITDKTPNSPAGHQLQTKANQKMWIMAINGEYPTTDQGVFDKIN